jgi:Na+/melibiose symporter-like transporter
MTGLWVFVCYALLVTAYSAFAVPYLALPAELTTDTGLRGALVGWRMVAAMAGILLGAGAAPILVALGGGGRGGHAVMGAIIALAALAAMGTATVFAASHPRGHQTRPISGLGLREALALAARSPILARLLIAYLLQMVSVGIISAAAPYVLQRILRRPESDLGLVMAGMIALSLVSAVPWSRLRARLAPFAAFAAACLAYAACAAALGAGLALGAGMALAFSAFVLMGMPFAGLQVLPFAAASDAIHTASRDVGCEAALTGLWTATEKLGLATGPAVVAACLAMSPANPVNGFAALIGGGVPLLLGLSLLVLRPATMS